MNWNNLFRDIGYMILYKIKTEKDLDELIKNHLIEYSKIEEKPTQE